MKTSRTTPLTCYDDETLLASPALRQHQGNIKSTISLKTLDEGAMMEGLISLGSHLNIILTTHNALQSHSQAKSKHTEYEDLSPAAS